MRKGDQPEIVDILTSINQTSRHHPPWVFDETDDSRGSEAAARYMAVVTRLHSASQLQNLPISFRPSPPPPNGSLREFPPSSTQPPSRSCSPLWCSAIFHISFHPLPIPTTPAVLLFLLLLPLAPLSYRSSVPRFAIPYIENTKCLALPLSFCQHTQFTRLHGA